jgi:hypothetical protein
MKQNALSPFACNVRRSIGNCEWFKHCPDKFNFDTQKPCDLDVDKISKTSIQELISLIRDGISGLPLPDSAEEEYKKIYELFDCLENELACVVGKLGIGLQNAWPANLKTGDEYMKKYWAEHPEDK